MNNAVRNMLDRYACKSRDDYAHAVREILQELALLGLWRSKFFEHAAFYGGTALRVLYGLDRFSEDIDFSLLAPDPEFDLSRYGEALRNEIRAFGFDVRFERKPRASRATAIESAFLKADTVRQLIVLEAGPDVVAAMPPGRQLTIKLEVDTDPPPGFATETRFLLQPVAFAVRAYALPDLLAGKVHAVLCRRWKSRVKGRDWYDLVWYAGHHPRVRLAHLEARMRQSGHYAGDVTLTMQELQRRLASAVEALDIRQAAAEVEPFVRDPASLSLWSRDFFLDVVRRLVDVGDGA